MRTLLRDEYIQELEEELTETRLVWDIIEISEVSRPEECFTTLQSGHLLYHSQANNGQAGVGILINRKWKHHIASAPESQNLVLYVTKRYKLKIVQVYAPTTTSYSEDINSFYNDIDETRKIKPLHDSREKNKT